MADVKSCSPTLEPKRTKNYNLMWYYNYPSMLL